MSMHASLPIAVHVFLMKNNEVLLLERKNTGFNDGKWSVPAGRLDVGETVTQAAIREVKEEVGVDIEHIDVGSPLTMVHHDDRGERIYFFFLVKKWTGREVNKEPDKCSTLRWFDKKNLPKSIIGHIATALEQMEKGSCYIEYGFE